MTQPRSLVAYPDGIWRMTHGDAPPIAEAARPALFLDRDGVLVEEVDHLHRPEDVRLHRGATAIVREANACGVPVVVITNQGGIGRGLYGWDDFVAVTATIDDALAAAGARIDAVYACPYHRDGVPDYRHPDHPARKPNPGMLLRAGEELRIALGESWFVGDHADDIRAAHAARLSGAIHVLTGHGPHHRPAVQERHWGPLRVLVADDIEEAHRLLPLLQRPAGA